MAADSLRRDAGSHDLRHLFLPKSQLPGKSPF